MTPQLKKTTQTPLKWLCLTVLLSACSNENNGAEPTPAPTVTPTLAPTATPTASSAPTPPPTPTLAPTATPTVSPTPAPTATPSAESARVCLNPYLYAVGSQVNRVVRVVDKAGNIWRVTSETQVDENTDELDYWRMGELLARTDMSRVLESDPDAPPQAQSRPYRVYFTFDADGERIAIFNEHYPPFYGTPPGGGDAQGEPATYINSPPGWVFRYDLVSGESHDQTYRANWEYQIGPIQGFNSYEVSATIRFAGIESVTVPAGIFDACRFDEVWEETNLREQTSLTFTRTTWLAKGSGIRVRFEQGNVLEELISAEIGGVAVVP